DLVAPAGLDMPVDAVVTDVQLAAEEPLGVGELPLEDGVERLEPGDALRGLLFPEILQGLAVDIRPGVGIPRKLGGRRVAALLQLHRLDGMRAGLDRHRLIQPPSRELQPLSYSDYRSPGRDPNPGW